MSATHRIELDVRTPLVEAPETGHNRWHPEIPAALEVARGDTVVLDVRDGLDGQFTMESGHADVLELDLGRGHPCTGPIAVEGAEPGDLLEVEVLEIEPDDFGWTCVIPGMGLLGDRFDSPYLARWSIADGVARSPDIPGAAIRGVPFLGVAAVAPSQARLEEFTAREAELLARGGSVLPPDPGSAVPTTGPPAEAGLRTVPPRENGGNMDVKQLTTGSRLLLGVDVPGAMFSAGDPHFHQGEGELCGVAIEMHARVTVRLAVRAGAELAWRPRFPVIEHRVPAERRRDRDELVTMGIPLDDEGRNENLDLNLAAKAALNEMVDYLVAARGYSPEQAYILVSAACDLRAGSVPNIPNVLATVHLPLDIFEASA